MLRRLSIIFILLPLYATAGNILVPDSAQKSVLVPTSDIGDDWWQNISYNDSNWVVMSGAPGGVGYELSSGYADYIGLDLENEMSNNGDNPNNSCYIRILFTVSEDDTADQTFIQLNIRYDDGFVAYLNGQKVAQADAPDILNWNSNATSDQGEAGAPVQIVLDASINDLIIGQNLLAIHGLNYATSSSDFLITAELETGKLIGDFDSSNIPIMVINTDGIEIVHEPKIPARMGIINNGSGNRNSITDPFNEYDGWIGIEYRGNASFRISDKKPYTIETRNEDGSNRNVEILGLPSENDFVLRAVYIDKTLMRDALVYYMYRSMGRWAPRTRHLELFLNGSYQGVYILEEKIKPDKNRLDITKMDSSDISGEALTGGYIWCINHRWGDEDHNDLVFDSTEADGNERFLKYPKPNDVTPEQFAYISQLEQEFCDVMAGPNYNNPFGGYTSYIDVSSFIDELVIQEITSNSDAYSYSGFFHKDRGGKICAGPEWDFDQALCNSTHNDGARTDEWIVLKPDGARPPFWDRLFPEPAIQAELKTKWNTYRKDALSKDRILAYIDSVTNYLSEAQEHNFNKWPILGVSIWRSLPGVEERDTYQKEVDYMKSWLLAHLEWMDKQLELPTNIEDNKASKKVIKGLSLKQNYPNPFNPITKIEYKILKKCFVTLKIYNLLGEEVAVLINQEQTAGEYIVNFDASNLASGIYIYKIFTSNNIQTKKMILIK
jgi:hypothetical protein